MRFLKTLPGLLLCAAGITYLMLDRDTIIASALICAVFCLVGVALTHFIFTFKKRA